MNVNDQAVLQELKAVHDPEIGINIVDLGLVYRATRTPVEIAVEMTMTSPSCPLGEMLTMEAEDVLRRRFPNTPSVHVQLVWDPPWSPDRISGDGQKQFAPR